MRIPALLFILTLITLCTAAQAPPAPPRKPAAARLARKLLCSKCHLNVRATSASSQPATTLPTCLDPLGYFTTLLQTCGIFKIEVTPSGLLSISSTLGSQQYYLHIDRRGDLRGSTGYGELVLADAVGCPCILCGQS
ncbi:MAG: hypothetical protein M1829_003148 [Trizodia sp. TS-e1964]|nr:MAG: hypothetical protein M1829_003148 [Trizodia sp. TS-e1964]